MARSKAVGNLRRGIDNEVYTVAIRLLEDDTLEATVPALYQAIQKSNSGLKRKPKRLIEDSLERVLAALDDNEDEEAVLEAEHNKSQPPQDANIMNKSLTSAWKVPAPATPNGNETPTTAPEASRNASRAQSAEPQRKRKREGTKEAIREGTTPKVRATLSSARFDDLGGVDDIVKQLKNILILPLRRPFRFARMSLPLPRGVLLHGPPGCGKSQLARACAAETGVPVIEIQGPSIVSGMSGESEKQVRDAFDEARKAAPCILFIDEIDVIAPKRESSQSQMEKRIVAQLLISMDSLEMDKENEDQKPVIVLAATNRPDSLDPALRRGGRFDTEINMGVPNEKTRALILRALTKNTPLSPDVDFTRLARMTPGFVGADLRDLVGKAGAYTNELYMIALEKQASSLPPNGSSSILESNEMDVDPPTLPSETAISEEIASYRRVIARLDDPSIPEPAGHESESVCMSAFLSVLPTIVPSGKREGFATVPDTTWDNIGALTSVRQELQLAIVEPIRFPERYAAVGLSAPAGVLLWGPPGCGKTLLAKAVANESKANFISVKGPELLNKFVGESERALRTVFTRARSSIPCVIFFDELDALVPKRDDGGNEASARVVNTLLTELDGLSSREGIYVIAATNRPDIIDEAMLRPGRLETLLFIDLPGPGERAEILEALVRQKRKAGGVWPMQMELDKLANGCKDFSGADLGALVRKAALEAVKRQSSEVSIGDFEKALPEVHASVTSMERYERLKKKFGLNKK
ncbi:AAA-domain-containing protein [Myriangium duriaei CBS 260.36]|uniref:Peroxisomal ATPase PEX1 n=1 Tax=Myriangium duriaei CBS 260.36 TaxID=1168546 RepID=A0A9P4J442_9PEZI|nr:AAA-domain-containing protein [Myriangium duriaei CBS 260.36]